MNSSSHGGWAPTKPTFLRTFVPGLGSVTTKGESAMMTTHFFNGKETNYVEKCKLVLKNWHFPLDEYLLT